MVLTGLMLLPTTSVAAVNAEYDIDHVKVCSCWLVEKLGLLHSHDLTLQ